jgi:aspartyl-tRNA(Asn)/glutamyl-tRNA(Gln) amidotransferase subunit A
MATHTRRQRVLSGHLRPPLRITGSSTGSTGHALAADPIDVLGGIAEFAAALREGGTTSAAATRSYLERIAALEPQLQCFEVVLADAALATSEAIDALLAAGTDLGPLMGVPVAVKDIYAVADVPTTNGSNHASADITGPEGSFVASLRAAGCVIIGKTKTSEYAFSATGENQARGTPHNPYDLATHRWPGGSSSGSGVAMAAGLAGFTIGSDTGGSVRIPAALNGVFGHKTTIGWYPTDGVFPLSPTLDTVGPLCRTAADAALIHAALDPSATTPSAVAAALPTPPALDGLVFGRPLSGGAPWFEENLDDAVAKAFEDAVSALVSAGVRVVDVELSDFGIDPDERTVLFPNTVAVELITAFGSLERFEEVQKVMDPKTAQRSGNGLAVSGVDYVNAVKRIDELAVAAESAFAKSGCACWLTPTVTMLAGTVEELATPAGADRGGFCSRNTQPANLLGGCAVSLPMATDDPGGLPAGLQMMFPAGGDVAGLALARAVEKLLPAPPRPALG